MTLATAPPLAFSTSGSTGAPVRWERTAAQVRAEAQLLAVLCAPGADGIVCYAPPEHLYGYLMGRALPDLLGVPVRPIGLTDPPGPAFAGLRRPVVAALPAALRPLLRCLPLLRGLERLTLVHSSALLPYAAVTLLDRLGPRARMVELFGSTETGLVATRRDPHRPLWTLAPDVRFAPPLAPASAGAGPGALEASPPPSSLRSLRSLRSSVRDDAGPGAGPGPHQLRISSPRIAARPGRPPAAEHELDDVVEIVDDRTFRWIGRSSRLVKVNGRRVNLDRVADTLRAAVTDVSLDCRPHPDDLRGEWYAVLVDDPRAVTAVAAACRRLPSWQQPSAVRSRETTSDRRLDPA
jgi:hypothetical protein